MGRSPACSGVYDVAVSFCGLVSTWSGSGVCTGGCTATWGGVATVLTCVHIATSTPLLACFGRRFGCGWTSIPRPRLAVRDLQRENRFPGKGALLRLVIYRSWSTIWVDRPQWSVYDVAVLFCGLVSTWSGSGVFTAAAAPLHKAAIVLTCASRHPRRCLLASDGILDAVGPPAPPIGSTRPS